MQRKRTVSIEKFFEGRKMFQVWWKGVKMKMLSLRLGFEMRMSREREEQGGERPGGEAGEEGGGRGLETWLLQLVGDSCNFCKMYQVFRLPNWLAL